MLAGSCTHSSVSASFCRGSCWSLANLLMSRLPRRIQKTSGYASFATSGDDLRYPLHQLQSVIIRLHQLPSVNPPPARAVGRPPPRGAAARTRSPVVQKTTGARARNEVFLETALGKAPPAIPGMQTAGPNALREAPPAMRSIVEERRQRETRRSPASGTATGILACASDSGS